MTITNFSIRKNWLSLTGLFISCASFCGIGSSLVVEPLTIKILCCLCVFACFLCLVLKKENKKHSFELDSVIYFRFFTSWYKKYEEDNVKLIIVCSDLKWLESNAHRLESAELKNVLRRRASNKTLDMYLNKVDGFADELKKSGAGVRHINELLNFTFSIRDDNPDTKLIFRDKDGDNGGCSFIETAKGENPYLLAVCQKVIKLL